MCRYNLSYCDTGDSHCDSQTQPNIPSQPNKCPTSQMCLYVSVRHSSGWNSKINLKHCPVTVVPRTNHTWVKYRLTLHNLQSLVIVTVTMSTHEHPSHQKGGVGALCSPFCHLCLSLEAFHWTCRSHDWNALGKARVRGKIYRIPQGIRVLQYVYIYILY